MTSPRIFACICALLWSSLYLCAQESQPTDSVEHFRGVQFDHSRVPTFKEQPVFCGVSVGVDVAGAVMAQVAKFGQYEVDARLNFKQRYFGAFEVGVGVSDHTNSRTDQHYKVNSPYFRVGADYNLAKNPVSGNRIYVGVRYGFSSFSYDLSGPSIIDESWGGAMPYQFNGLHSRMHWGEAVVGLEGRLWRFIHVGWTGRCKARFAQKKSPHGAAYYVPGYGDNSDKTCFGGSFSVIFDISDIKNSRKHK